MTLIKIFYELGAPTVPGAVLRRFRPSLLFLSVIVVLSCERPAMTAPASRELTTGIVSAPPANDRRILTELFNSTGGHEWDDNAGWLSDKPLNQWFGIEMRNGRVVSLDLPGNNLIGPLPAGLAGLDSLITLNLPNNGLTGQIPTDISSFARLRDLFLNGNQFSGSLPDSLGNAHALRYLTLSRNRSLRGPLPQSLSQLSLRTFFTDSTALCLPDTLTAWHGAIPRRSVLPACESSAADRAALVSLYHDLQGPGWTRSTNWLTDEPIRNWYGVEVDRHGRVVELRLNVNNLTGVLPHSLWALTALTNLEMYSNKIIGYIPPGIGLLSSLTNLELDANQLSGRLPPELLALRQLRGLELQNNELTGQLPFAIGHMKTLIRLYLWQNRFYGPLPPSLGNLTNLKELSLSENRFSGPIPPELGNLTELTGLALHSNQFTDSIPSTFGNLVNLGGLWLSNNNLSHAPPDLGKLTALWALELDNNLITGSIPAAWGKMASLRQLNLGSNQFSGSIPAALGDLKNLEELYFYQNNLTGQLPPELGNLLKLSTLSGAFNQLSGSLPAELATVGSDPVTAIAAAAPAAKSTLGPTHKIRRGPELPGVATTESNGIVITSIDLRTNRFSGRLPKEWGAMRHLVSLNLEGNPELSGVFPLSFAELIGLRYLYTRGTNLCLGHDPRLQEWAASLSFQWGLQQCTPRVVNEHLLREIYDDMDGGGWADAEFWNTNVPIWRWRGVSLNPFGQVSRLTLANMNVTGEMSPAIGRLGALQTLILSGNDIRGRIPDNVAFLQLLRTLDVTNNPKLQGIMNRDFLGIPLRSLRFDGTAVCVPDEAEFDEWIDEMDVYRGSRCVRKQGSLSIGYVQVVQSIQTERHDVPLVIGRDVALRTYITGDERGYYGDVPIKATIRRRTGELFTKREVVRGFELRGDHGVRLDAEADLTIVVPGEWIRPGITVEVEVENGNSATRERYVVEDLNVQEARSIVMTLVPIVSLSGSDRSVIDWVDDNAELVGRKLEDWFGFREVSTHVHDAYVTSVNLASNAGPVAILAELAMVRLLEQDESFWYGVGNSTTGYFRGLAEFGGSARVSVGKNTVQEAGHESGHVFGLRHAPCGGATFRDEQFPYEDGSLGGWAYDMKSGEVVGPREGRDIMGYCYGSGTISDYNYKKTLREFSGRVADVYAARDARTDNSTGSMEETLVLWGYLNGGRMQLEPPLVMNIGSRGSQGVRFTRMGEYSVQLYEEGGALHFAGNFDMQGDSEGGKHFVMGIPTRARSIKRVVLSGPGGTAEVTVEDGRSVTIVRSPGNGSVRAILRDWSGSTLPDVVMDGVMPVEISTTVGLARDMNRSGCLLEGGRASKVSCERM